MESSEVNQANLVLIKQLLSGKNADLKLPHNVNFVFNLEDATAEMSAERLIAAVDDEQFAELFDMSVRWERASEIRVVAIKPEQFISLLRFVYARKLKLADLHSNYAAAQQYSMSDICEALIKFADSKLSINNSVILLDQYCKIGDSVCDEKIGELLGIISLNAFLVVHSEEFPKIDKSTLIRLLKNDQLFVQEKDLYYAVLRWMDSELQRQGLEANLENKHQLFNELKPLIRFPIMRKHQFFTAVRRLRYSESQENLRPCPAKSGLFSQTELDEFEQYFETKDATVLSIGYSTEERAEMKIGMLELVENEEYWMSTDFDALHRKDVSEECASSYLNTDCCVENCGDSYEYVYDEEYEQIKSKPITAKARRNNLICGTNSIRVFRIHVTGSSSYWDYGEHIQIIENGTLLPTYYKRYCISNTFGMYDYWPTFEMKANNAYDFQFVCPGEGKQATKMKLDNVYTETENGELVLDVKLRITGILAWAQPTHIFFLYK